MLRPVDSPAEETAVERQRWMGILAQAQLECLEQGMAALAPREGFTWLRRPETGLLMVRGRVGGTGDRFNFGEVTVTRCALRVASGKTGVAYVQGRSHRKAELAALADALLQEPATHDAVRVGVIEPARRDLEAVTERMRRRAQATRVEFFTVARQAGP